MAVGPPAGGTQIDFHVAGVRRPVADLNDRSAEIRAALDTDKSGMKNADNLSIGGFQLSTSQPLMLPGGLQHALGRRTVFVVQNMVRGGLPPPGGVEIFGWRKHFPNFLRPRPVKVKPPDLILNASIGGMDCLTKTDGGVFVGCRRCFSFTLCAKF